MQKLNLKGFYEVQLIRNGEVIATRKGQNGITDEGRDLILDVMFDAGSQEANWYLGLIDNAGFSALDAGDTMASHAGWAEIAATDVVEATRVEWNPDAAADQEISNATARVYTLDDTVTVYGLFVTSDNTLGGTTGVLWATGAFGQGPLPGIAGDLIRVIYTVTTALGS